MVKNVYVKTSVITLFEEGSCHVEREKAPLILFLQRTFLDSDKTKWWAVHIRESDDSSNISSGIDYNIFIMFSNFSITLPFFQGEYLAFYSVVFSIGNKALFPKPSRENG